MSSEHFVLHVNGEDHDVNESWLGESLLSVLRDRIGLMGTKGACEQGECGSSRPVNSAVSMALRKGWLPYCAPVNAETRRRTEPEGV